MKKRSGLERRISPLAAGCRIGAGLIFVLFLPPVSVLSRQEPAATLLDRAVDNARRYTNAMRNLTAEERRLTELFDKNGKVRKRRQTISDLVIHTAGTDTLAEFRSIRAVDGKPIKGGERRLESLSRKLADADSLTNELDIVDRESSRYDLDEMRMKGMVLNQAWPLEEDQFRRAAQFTRGGTAAIAGRNTVTVNYEIQNTESSQSRTLHELLKPARVFVRGHIWIDMETAEIWKYETETMVQETPSSEPLAWDHMEFDYVPSSFGVPTPRRIAWVSNSTISREKGKLRLTPKGRVIAEYGAFKRFGTDVQIVPLGTQ